MVVPAIEIVVTRVGSYTIDDENTDDGQTWLSAFSAAAENIPGCVRACWARSHDDPNVCMHFIDYETRRQHNIHKDTLPGPIPSSLKGIMKPETTDLYIIHPHTPDRHVLYAPHTHCVFFYGINEPLFSTLAPEFFTAINNSDSCLGYIWGEFQPPFLADGSGNMQLGRGGVMIIGWRSGEECERDWNLERVKKAWERVQEAAKKVQGWGMQVTVVENNGWFHKWRRVFDTDRGSSVDAPGKHL